MKTRLGLMIIVVGVAAVAIIVLIGLLRRPPAPTPTTQTGAVTGEAAQGPLKGDVTLQGTKLTQKDAQGNPLWSMQADTQFKFDSQKQVAEGNRAHWVLQQGGQTAWDVDAPSVVFRYETGDLEFTDGVQLYSPERGQRFTVKRLIYVPGTKELRGEGPVRMTGNGATVTAGSVVVDTVKHTVKFGGGVKCHLGM